MQDKIQEVVQRIQSDPEFAATVKSSAEAAVKAGADSPAFNDYMALFATSPTQLRGLATASAAMCTCNSNTWITLASLTSPLNTCTTTTTTTTSGN